MEPDIRRVAVKNLGYLGIGTRKLSDWQRFATQVLGLAVDHAEDRLRLRMDDRPWRFDLVDDAREDILFAGFEVADESALSALQAHLRALGYAVREGDTATAAQRCVTALIIVDDPDGLTIEIYCGAHAMPERPFVSAAGVSGFVTGVQGLGHIALSVSSVARARRFYEEGLGFRVSDLIDLPVKGGVLGVVFLHCNARQHTVAVAPLPTSKRLLHFMIQAKSISDVGMALDRAKDANCEISLALGQHTNDEMVSFYVESPSGFDVEFGWGGRTIGPDWSVRRYAAGSIWGHRPGT